MSKTTNTNRIKQIASELGFSFCGIAKAQKLEEEAVRLEQWLNNNSHGKMSYMENHFDKRIDPTLLVPGAKSVISMLYNYYPKEELKDSEFKLSKYAYGMDYHFVIKDKLKTFVNSLQTEIGDFDARVFVDSAPVMDKAWASRAGLGWIGKNSNLINKQMGSFFFIAEIICDLDLEYDGPVTDHCGTCTACIDACPTDAIANPYIVDGSKCISYLTIELKEEIPFAFQDKMDNWMFGCDVCQDVCPWNRFSKVHNEPNFEPNEKLQSMDGKQWTELTKEIFNEIFRKSAVKRTKYSGLTRNINFINQSKKEL